MGFEKAFVAEVTVGERAIVILNQMENFMKIKFCQIN